MNARNILLGNTEALNVLNSCSDGFFCLHYPVDVWPYFVSA